MDQKSNIELQLIIGSDIANYIKSIADFRIKVFKEYPYLYEGSLESEYEYLKNYVTHSQSVLVIATVQGKIVGLATGVPVVSDFPLLKDVCAEYLRKNKNPADYYHYGEVMIDSNFRSQGIGSKLLKLIDEKIKAWNFHHICVFTVIRAKDHILRHEDYIDTHKILHNLGFQKSGYEIRCEWPTIINFGEVKIIENTMELWEKRL